MTLFLSLGGTLEGYGKANITPYIHAMVYHVPHLMRIHNGIRKFSGQGKYINYNMFTESAQIYRVYPYITWESSVDSFNKVAVLELI